MLGPKNRNHHRNYRIRVVEINLRATVESQSEPTVRTTRGARRNRRSWLRHSLQKDEQS
jgi:hypothetical protein